jgi:hypothetical protein
VYVAFASRISAATAVTLQHQSPQLTLLDNNNHLVKLVVDGAGVKTTQELNERHSTTQHIVDTPNQQNP